MIKVAIIFIVIMLLVVWPLPKLLKEAPKREIILFLVLYFIGFLLHAGLTLQVRIPNPSDGVIMLLKPLSNWVYQFLA